MAVSQAYGATVTPHCSPILERSRRLVRLVRSDRT